MVSTKGTSLAKRAKAMPMRGRTSGPLVEYLAFCLAKGTYGVPIGAVREILKLPPVTPVPRAPREVLGVVSVRGQLVTLIDLRYRLGLDRAPPGPLTRVLLTEGPEKEIVGLFVDEVLQVYRLAASEIELSSSVAAPLAEHVAGIGRPPGVLLTLIDLRPLLELG